MHEEAILSEIVGEISEFHKNGAFPSTEVERRLHATELFETLAASGVSESIDSGAQMLKAMELGRSRMRADGFGAKYQNCWLFLTETLQNAHLKTVGALIGQAIDKGFLDSDRGKPMNTRELSLEARRNALVEIRQMILQLESIDFDIDRPFQRAESWGDYGEGVTDAAMQVADTIWGRRRVGDQLHNQLLRLIHEI